MKNGPDFPEAILDMIKEILNHTAGLQVFTWVSFTVNFTLAAINIRNSWDSKNGEIPVSIVVHLSKHCPLLEELHLTSGLEKNRFRYELRNFPEKPFFENVRVFTCKSIATFHALYILHQCPNIELVQMTHMEHMLALGWMHGDYHGHLKALIVREEMIRARSGKPLKMFMCYSRISRICFNCEVCDSPGMSSYNLHDEKYTEVWPWAAGRARQYLVSGQVRHINYEYPHPGPAEMGVHPAFQYR